ncbi:MAG: C1 family peptidase [Bacteroidia bacterium]
MRTSLLSFFIAILFPFAATAQKVDFRHCQSPVRAMPVAANHPALPVCDLMETFSGIPHPLSTGPMIPDHGQIIKGSTSSHLAFILTSKGLALSDNGSSDAVAHYRCPENTVLAVTDRAKINDTRKLTKLLDQGLRGIVVTYDWTAKDWKNGGKRLLSTKTKTKPKRLTHSILIVGYEDSTFIFKNNWGQGWGESGYGKMSFAYHRTHAREGLFAYMSESVEPSTDAVANVGLRLQCELLEGKPQIQASVFADGPGKLPAFSELKYSIRRSDQKAVFPKSVILMEAARPTGYPAVFELPEPEATYVFEVQYRIGDSEEWTYLQAQAMRWGDPVVCVRPGSK